MMNLPLFGDHRKEMRFLRVMDGAEKVNSIKGSFYCKSCERVMDEVSDDVLLRSRGGGVKVTCPNCSCGLWGKEDNLLSIPVFLFEGEIQQADAQRD